MATTEYGDISPRTAAYAAVELLTRGMPYLVLEKFGQNKPLPANNSKSMIFRRYNNLALATTALTEGVTPTSLQLSKTDVPVTLAQYGSLVEITDVIADTHEDPVLKESIAILGEQASKTLETLRFNTLKAGTNKFYANGTARTDVNTVLTTTLQRKVVRSLKRQNANQITSIIRSTPAYGTDNVLPAYVGIAHVDLEGDIRGMSGFIDAKDYGQVSPYEGEIGAVEGVRYILSSIFESYADAGGAKGSMISTTGTSADVYPVLFLAKDSWASVALKGKFAVTPTVINPTPTKSDPLGQRGSVAWKTYFGCVILNDAWMAVAEVAATA